MSELFIGLEAEGPDVGKKTLFIGTDFFDVTTIIQLLSLYGIKRIYLGAGNYRRLPDMKCLRSLIEKCESDIEFVAEISDRREVAKIPLDFKERIHITYTVVFGDDVDTIKVENSEELFWIEEGEVYYTKLSCELYNTDEEVKV